MEDTTWIPLVASTTSRSNLSPTFKPTWKPFMTSSSPFWISSWTTPRPFYNRSEHVNYHDYNHAHRESRYQDYGPHLEWKPNNGNLRQSFDNNYEFQDRQWINHRIDQNPQPVYHSDPEGSWSYEHRNPNHRYDHRYYPPGYHYHHHHHHYHNYGPTSNPSIPTVNPNWNAGNPTTLIGDQKYDQGYQGYTPNAGDSWHFNRNDSNHYDHHYFEHVASSETDQRHQPYFPSKEYNDNNSQFSNVYKEIKFSNLFTFLIY